VERTIYREGIKRHGGKRGKKRRKGKRKRPNNRVRQHEVRDKGKDFSN